MSEEHVFTATGPLERRLHSRHKARSDVYVQTPAGNIHCRAVNLSATGVGLQSITGTPLALTVGVTYRITFALNFDRMVKLHRRSATVKYIRNGIIGMQMEFPRTW